MRGRHEIPGRGKLMWLAACRMRGAAYDRLQVIDRKVLQKPCGTWRKDKKNPKLQVAPGLIDYIAKSKSSRSRWTDARPSKAGCYLAENWCSSATDRGVRMS